MIKRGDIFFANLSPVEGSEQGGHRPVLIISNNQGNKFSPTVIIAIITSINKKVELPTHYILSDDCGLKYQSMVECEQIRTIDRKRLCNYIGKINKKDQKEIDKKLKISLDIL